MSHRRIFIIILSLALSFQLVACDNEPAPEATATPSISPLEIAAHAADAMLAVESLHFKIERDGALVYIDENQMLAFKRARGDFALPDDLQAIVRVITVFTPVDIGMIVLGDKQYATDPITGQWDRLPPEWGEFNLAVLFDPEVGLQGLLKDGIRDLALEGVEDVDEQAHYRLTGRVDGERISAATMGFIGDGDVEVKVWIGAEDYLMRRLHIVEPATDSDDPTTWDLEFSQLGEPVEINAPPVPDL